MTVQTRQTNRISIQPQPGPQTQFLECSADIAIFGGSAGGGKSYALIMDAARVSTMEMGRAVLFRRETPQIRNSGALWDTAFSIYRHLPRVKARDSVLDFKFDDTGARIELRHMEKEKDRYNWQGSQVDMLGWDELTHFTEKQFWYVTLSRSRGMSGAASWTRATCNPVPETDPIGGWVNKLISWWVDQKTGYAIPERSGIIRYFYRVPAMDENDKDRLYWYDSVEEAREAQPMLASEGDPLSFTFICATLDDNPALTKANPGYKSKLLALGRVEREQLLRGNWNVKEDITGAIWSAPETIRYTSDDAFYDRVDQLSCPIIGGWDFGSGVSLLCNPWGLIEMGPLPKIWIDKELTWQQTSWRSAASDSMEVYYSYCDKNGQRRGTVVHFGDPAGASRESDQSSWIANLRSGGVPLVRLTPQHNTRPTIEWGIKQTQLLIDDGRLRIHERCTYLWSVLCNWRRNVPEGAVMDHISKKVFEPRHDVYSHGGMALVYLVMGAMGYFGSVKRGAQQRATVLSQPPTNYGGASPTPTSNLGVAPIMGVLPRRLTGNVTPTNIRDLLGR